MSQVNVTATATSLSKPPLLGFLDQQFNPQNILIILWTASSPNPEWLCQLTMAHSCSGRSVPGQNQLSTSYMAAVKAVEGLTCLGCDSWVALSVQRPYLAFFSILFSVKLHFFSSQPALCISPDKVCLTQRWSFHHSYGLMMFRLKLLVIRGWPVNDSVSVWEEEIRLLPPVLFPVWRFP